MEKFFKLKENGTDVKTEVIAGITTFMTMAYILAVNPNILADAGMDRGAVFTATAVAAFLGTALMALLANYPFALAPGMGLNAYFAYTVVLGMGYSWQTALSSVFVEGIIFIFLTLFKVREAVVNSIPLNMKYGVTAGIGIFIAFLGLKGCGLIVANEATFVSMGHLSPTVIFAFIGLFVIGVMDKKNIKGSILAGIAISSIMAWIYAALNPEMATKLGIYLPTGIFKFESIAPVAGKVDFGFFSHPTDIGNFFVIVCTFLFVDFFDTVGTLVGVCSKANMLDEDGNVPNVGRALLADSLATTIGALLGVSTVTTYVESSTGVLAGGKTGYTAITVGILFLIAMFFSPIFIAIPACATAPALIYVGYLMISSLREVDLHNVTEGLPAFITVISMALTYSIGDGLTIGILSYVIINLVYNIFAKPEEREKVSWVMIILGILFLIKLLFL